MSDALVTAYNAALDGMRRTGPKRLHQLAAVMADDATLSDGQALTAHLRGAGPEDALRQTLAHALASWDYAADGAPWTAGTARNTVERRAAILRALRVDDATADLFADMFPVAMLDTPVVIADEWEEWRTPRRRAERDFYWNHYREHLLGKGWDPDAVAGLGTATEEVVGRLSDPTRPMAYTAKGLVVGYVQSGKTANFTGVAAKAIDAGYRLVIVLTGTTNMLRAQTQRRLDMELCGRENLEIEISPQDKNAHDYQDDPDWIGDNFLRHGGRPSDAGFPDIFRLSNHSGDYRRLKQGFSTLEFTKRERNKALYDTVNLFTSDARLVVAKKNSTVLGHLAADLDRVSSRLSEVPVLIIDDESDQASVNTISPKKWKEGRKERTAINKWIGELLRLMPRAQYVGYTATPYANIFIDPSDDENIFPRNFLISLPRPEGYMGAEDFYDQDTSLPVKQRPLATSRERAHVRFLADEPEDRELLTALDMYLLTAAVKVHRERLGAASYRHHTMLVHEAMDRASHRDAAAVIKSLWNSAGHHSGPGLARLRMLYEQDVLPVARALAPDLPTPADFADLRQDLGEALRRITPPDPDGTPVIIVNSDSELERQQESLDFDRRSVWRILVGGNKLARGFTVEGLTITYYRRAAGAVDTLMQMGRWFGFRPAYRDLVRLYTTPEIHSMFTDAHLDEQYLRDELRQYADGHQITPAQIPPLIAQHRPDLRPTARNKMWNARIVEKSSPGRPMEPVAYPTTALGRRHNTEQWGPVLTAAAQRSARFATPGGTHYDAYLTELSHRDMVDLFASLKWSSDAVFAPEIRWLRSLAPHQLDRWVVIAPLQARTTTRRSIFGAGPFSIFERKPTSTGALSVASELRHRNAAQRIVGLADTIEDPDADALAQPATACILVYPTIKPDTISGKEGDPVEPDQLTIAFHAVTPLSSTPLNGKLIKWETIDRSQRGAIAVDI